MPALNRHEYDALADKEKLVVTFFSHLVFTIAIFHQIVKNNDSEYSQTILELNKHDKRGMTGGFLAGVMPACV